MWNYCKAPFENKMRWESCAKWKRIFENVNLKECSEVQFELFNLGWTSCTLRWSEIKEFCRASIRSPFQATTIFRQWDLEFVHVVYILSKMRLSKKEPALPTWQQEYFGGEIGKYWNVNILWKACCCNAAMDKWVNVYQNILSDQREIREIQLGEFVKTICINIRTCKRVLAHIIKMRGLDVPFAIFQPSHYDSKQSSGQSHKVAGAAYTGFDDCTEFFRFFVCSKKK